MGNPKVYEIDERFKKALLRRNILKAKNFNSVAGVDLMIEEKLKKYEQIIGYFSQLRNLNRVKENSQEDLKRLNMIQFISELDHLISNAFNKKIFFYILIKLTFIFKLILYILLKILVFF